MMLINDFKTQKLLSVFLKIIRKYFAEQNFTELEIPILNESLPLEPNIYSFNTFWNKNDGERNFYLPTSPESSLKKYLAQSGENCFAIAHSFRNLEADGNYHSPEFLMLEWYRKDEDYKKIIEDLKNLFVFIKKKFNKDYDLDNLENKVDEDALFDDNRVLNDDEYASGNFKSNLLLLGQNWIEFSLEDLFKKYAGINLAEVCNNKTALFQVAEQKGYVTLNATWEQIFNQIFLNEIEPELPKSLVILTDFPKRISPLCKTNPEKPYLAQRFEAYLFGVEIANGNQENTNWLEVKNCFEQEEKYRIQNHLPSHPIDLEFIESLKKMDNKNISGIGLGVDRLLKLLLQNN